MNILDKIKRRFLKDSLYHPATTMSFNKLYKGLMKHVKAGNINVQREDGLEIFSYSKSCVYDGAWDKFTLMARGLILCPKKKKIIALTFPKFFNFGEVSTKLPDLPFTVNEKVDGSLGLCYFYEDKWHVATKGSFQSEQAVWATNWLNFNVALGQLDTNLTYLTEIIYHQNKIVVSYSFEGLVLLGGYDLTTGLEVFNAANNWYATYGCKQPKPYYYDSLDDILKVAETLDVNNEGFVVRFSNGYRIKIKGSEYIRVHRLISNCTPLAIWDMLRNNDRLDLVRMDLPEEHRKDFDQIVDLLQNKFDAYVKIIKDFYEATNTLSDKELGLFLKGCSDLAIAKNFVFACRKKNFLTEVYETPGKQVHPRNALFETFRPTANVLEGFVPSSAMNRFEESI